MNSDNHNRFDIRRRLNSFKYAIQGLQHFFASEPHATIHLVAAILAVALGIFLNISQVEWCIIALLIALIFSAELFNSSLERICNKTNPEFHPLMKQAKDLAAAAVLVLAVASVVVGCLIFGKYFF